MPRIVLVQTNFTISGDALLSKLKTGGNAVKFEAEKILKATQKWGDQTFSNVLLLIEIKLVKYFTETEYSFLMKRWIQFENVQIHWNHSNSLKPSIRNSLVHLKWDDIKN